VELLGTGRRALDSRGRRWVLAVTLLGGVGGAIAVAAGVAPAERTFALISGAAHSLMSVGVPILGVLLVAGLRRPAGRTAVLRTVGTALGLALLVAAIGVLVCVAVTAIAPSAAPGGRWANAGVVALGSLLVQGVAMLVGTGLGLLLRRRTVAASATIVLPLGLWALCGALPALRPVQPWITPFPSAQHLLSGEMSPIRWAQWTAVLAIWGVGLHVLGLARAAHRPAGTYDAARSAS
jgi:hypothetical protein